MKKAILLVITLVFSCIEKEEKDFVVLEFNQDWYWIYKNAEPSNLKKVELDLIEQILIKAVEEYNLGNLDEIEKRKKWFKKEFPEKHFDESWPKLTIYLKDYKRQYFPVITENGEKEVWVNLFCTTEYTNWREEIVIYYDGGNCFFNLKINLDNQSYLDFHVNGHA
ncbi:hypothetical protein [Ulvibacterium sp.]|uniref:hypothetical protein n=1 Tax=Ulvibacterium sp. TaxID=2665914 RepID=UPI003BAAC83D